MRTYYLYQYSGVSHRRTLNDTLIATVRASNTDDAWWLFQDRDPKVKRLVGV